MGKERALARLAEEILLILRASRAPLKARYVLGVLQARGLETVDKTSVNRQLHELLEHGLAKKDEDYRWSASAPPGEAPAYPSRLLDSRQDQSQPERKSPPKTAESSVPELSVAELALLIARERPETEINELPKLPTRVGNSIRNEGVDKVRQLVRYSEDEILSWWGVGKKSVADLKKSLGDLARQYDLLSSVQLTKLQSAVTRLREKGRVEPDHEVDLLARLESQLLRELADKAHEYPCQAAWAKKPGKVTFIPVVTSKERGGVGSLLSLLPASDERDEAIFNRRVLREADRATLEELGRDFDVTRERIRQLEKKLTKRLESRVKLVIRELDPAIENLRRTIGLPVTVSMLEQFQPAFEGASKNTVAFARILEIGFSRHAICAPPGLDEPIITARQFADLKEIQEEVQKKIQEAGFDSVSELADRLREWVGKKEAPELWPLAMAWVDGALLVKNGIVFSPRTTDLVTAAVRAASRPLHVEEIEKRIRLAGNRVNPTTVRGAVARAAELVLVAPATFTTRDRLKKWRSLLPEIRQPLLELMETAPDRQWADQELTSWLRDRGLVGSDLDRYVLRFLLRSVNDLQYLGRGVWALSDSRSDHRIPIRELAVRLLKRAGAPLKKAELERRILEIRPLGKTGINVGGPLAYVESGVVGLLDRDLGLTRERSKRLIDRLENRSPGDPVPLEEMETIWRQIAPDAPRVETKYLAAALDTDRVARSGPESEKKPVTSKNTESPRRDLREALAGLDEETPVENVRKIVEVAMNRRYTDVALRNILRPFGLTIRGDTVVRG